MVDGIVTLPLSLNKFHLSGDKKAISIRLKRLGISAKLARTRRAVEGLAL